MLWSLPAQAQGRTAQPRAAHAPVNTGWVRESWSIADGLPVNSISVLLQSRAGYIWASTFDGLVRFDGLRFTVFNSENTPGLPSDRIVLLKEARDSSLWLTTEQGHLVQFARARFTHIDRARGLTSPVRVLFEDPAGELWIGTDDGLGRVRDGRFVPVARDTITGLVVSIVRRRDGSLWVATQANGVYRLASGQRTERVSVGTVLDSTLINALLEDPTAQLWIGTAGGTATSPAGATLALRERGAPNPYHFAWVPSDGAVVGYSPLRVYRYGRDGRVDTVNTRATQFVIGTPLRLRGRDSVWYVRGNTLLLNDRPVYDLDSVPGITGGRITDLLFDREGGIWLATEGNGLQRLRRSLFTVVGDREGLAATNAYVVTRDTTDAIWVGSLMNGVSRIAPDRQRVRNYGTAQGIPLHPTSMMPVGRDTMLIASPYTMHTCALPALTCRVDTAQMFGLYGPLALHRRTDGTIIAGTNTQILERTAGGWRPMREWSGAAPARMFANAADGALWVATNGNGIARCHAGRCRSITTADGLPTDIIRSLFIDGDGWLWIGTEGRGLARIDTKRWPTDTSGRPPPVVRYATADGLYDPVIHSIVDDGAGRLWMNSNSGIFWVRRSELLAFAAGNAPRIHSTAYTERDGLRNREGNGGFQPAAVRDARGLLWFPGQAGVVAVDPTRIPNERLPPLAAVEQVTTRDRRLAADSASLTLRTSERDLEIAFTALTFIEPGNVRFRYRLEPYDAEWVDAGNRRTAYYTRVPPGQYTFRVAASFGGDRWSTQASTVLVRIPPRWWETRSARALLALTLLLVGTVALRRWRDAARRREAELTALVGERTAALRLNEQELAAQNTKLATLMEARSQLFANLSHEFRTPLTLILGPLRGLLDGRHGPLSDGLREQGTLMLRNGERLRRLINQILDLARLQAGALTITRQHVDIVHVTRLMVDAFAPLAERDGITLALRTPHDTLIVGADAEQLEKVLLNLLSNAMKFTDAGGTVEVSVTRIGEDVVIAVRDTGVGIAATDLAHVFDRFYQADTTTTRRYEGTGIGLALAKELVELHGGTIGVTSASGVGSTFTVRLPRVEPDVAAVPGMQPGIAGDARFVDAIDAAVAASAARPAGERETWHDPEGAEDRREDRTTVLLVDDNTDMRAYLRSVLSPAYRVLEAADGKAGLALAVAALPDLIVADVMMPELDGLALARALKIDPMTDTIPVILLTARASATAQIEGLEAGADAYMVKPFDPGVLLAGVAGLLGQRHRLRDRLRSDEAPPTAAAAAAEASELDLQLRPLVEARLLDPDFNPEALAANAGLSYHQLYRQLRDDIGVTPSLYIRTVRVECAATLLRSGAGTITEIAYAVGFESLSYFRRAFRERFGQSPSEYLVGSAGR